MVASLLGVGMAGVMSYLVILNGLKKLSDERVNHTYKTAQVIVPVFLGFLLRIESFNEINSMIKNKEPTKKDEVLISLF